MLINPAISLSVLHVVQCILNSSVFNCPPFRCYTGSLPCFRPLNVTRFEPIAYSHLFACSITCIKSQFFPHCISKSDKRIETWTNETQINYKFKNAQSSSQSPYQKSEIKIILHRHEDFLVLDILVVSHAHWTQWNWLNCLPYSA